MTQIDGRLILGNERVQSPEEAVSINPATLKSLGAFSLATTEQCRRAVQAAEDAFRTWRDTSASQKKAIFLKAKKILLAQRQNLARLITEEKGSPLPESLAPEVLSGLEALDYYAKKAPAYLKPQKAGHSVTLLNHKRSVFHFSPLGPTLVISPWNYPFIIPLFDILSALAAGNTVVLRPSSKTVLTAMALGDIFVQAGLPPGVLNVVSCSVPMAEHMITDPRISVVMFTGSISTGKRVMELASRNLTQINLELGGKDPMIVCPDVDLDRAARGAVWGAFTNCGQSCGSVERVYVHQEIADAFTQKVLSLTKDLKVGNPLDPEVDIGPMTTGRQLEIVEAHIADAVRQGASVLSGGKRIKSMPGYFFQPTVLSKVDHSMKVMTEETFGPVLPIMPYSNLEEAVALANDSRYGLTASVWTRSRKTAEWMAAEIEAGTVTINDHMYSFIEPSAIWGGVKQSGIGRSHGRFGLMHLVNPKYVSQDFFKKKKALWWFPYDKTLNKMLDKALVLFHHSRFSARIKALFSLLPSLVRIQQGSPLRNFIKSLPRLFKK